MKRWAVLTIVLYVVLLAVLLLPVAMIAFVTRREGGGWGTKVDAGEYVALFQEWGAWAVLAVLVVGQALLLLVPVRIAERRPVEKRDLLLPVVAGSFFVALLFSAAVLCLLFAIWKDGPDWLEDVSRNAVEEAPGTSAMEWAGLPAGSDAVRAIYWIAAFHLCWLAWMAVFHRASRSDGPEAFVPRMTRWLLRGSILELLVAVPSHVIVRRRGDCCGPALTFAGIVAGLAVMLLSFGPGVFFLFAERMRRLRGGGGRERSGGGPPGSG